MGGVSAKDNVTPRAILLVDGEPDLLATYARLLRRRGFDARTALGQRSALAIIDRPDLLDSRLILAAVTAIERLLRFLRA